MSTWRGKLLGRLHCAETHPTFRGATLLGGLRCVLPATVRVGFNRFRLNRVDIYYNKLEPAGTTWNQLGTKLEPSCNQAGTKVEPSWNQLEPAGTTWNQLEPSWNQTGSKLEPAGTTWNQLEPSWNQAGTKLEASWNQAGTSKSKIRAKGPPGSSVSRRFECKFYYRYIRWHTD